MRIPLDRESSIPLYQQIETYLRQNIVSGNLPPDTRLPSIRQLAHHLGVNRITVENAYAELEADGLIFSRMGSGSFVLGPAPGVAVHQETSGVWPLWQQAIQQRSAGSVDIQPERILETPGHPYPISFADGVGDSRRFPIKDLRKIIQMVLNRDGIEALDYGDYRGYPPLRSLIAHILASQGLQTHSENILITSGSQQALALTAELIVKPGDVILVESPTYAGALRLFRALGLKIVGISIDDDGMQVEKLEWILQQYHPSLIYTMPNFQNPTGTCLSSQRRRQLMNVADRYNVPILEDDYVGDLRYEGRAQPALKSLDPGGRVIYASTFSKMLMPGLRVGFLIAEGPIYDSLLHYKRVHDLATSNLLQRSLEAYVTIGRYHTHLHRSCVHYRKRRDAMLDAIRIHLPDTVRVIRPLGGLFMWLTLPDGLSAVDLLPIACREGAAFEPGDSFFPEDSGGECCLRLNFAAHTPDEIEEGIKRLGKALHELL